MNTAAAPPRYDKRAIGLSVAVHSCALIALALIPLGRAGADVRDRCGTAGCFRVLTTAIEHRIHPQHGIAAASVSAPAGLVVSIVAANRDAAKPKPAEPRRARSGAAAAAAAHPESAQGHAAVIAANAAPAGVIPAAAPPVPETREMPVANVPAATATPDPGLADRTRAASGLGPGNWGSRWDAPALQDRSLVDDIVSRIGRRGSITIKVDDSGHALQVQINAPGLDPATLEDLRKRLLAAQYLPVERDGIAFEGTLQIRGR